MARRDCGSSPVVGSSRKRIAGSCIKARAIFSLCAMPPAKPIIFSSPRLRNSNRSSNWIARHVNFFDPSNATGRKHSGSENTDGRGLAGAVGTEQAKKFAARHFKRNAFKGLDLDTLSRLRLVGLSQLFNCDYCFHKVS